MTMQNGNVSRRSFLQAASLVGSGVIIGAIWKEGTAPVRTALARADASPDATAARQAELDELHELQTRVANPPVCTPAATNTPVPPTPTPTEVPVAPMNTPVSYDEIWTITVLGITPVPAISAATPAGKFMQVNLKASHAAPTAKILRLTDFILRDSRDRFSIPNAETNRAVFGNLWLPGVDPGVTEDAAILFDVAADAGDSFILESRVDPTFRVAMTVEQRG